MFVGKKQLHLIEESIGVSLSADTQGKNLEGEYFGRVIPSTLSLPFRMAKMAVQCIFAGQITRTRAI